jgi:hypothetical protein
MEMNQQEMLITEGGNVICTVVKAVKAVAEVVVALAEIVIDALSCDC